MAATVLGIVGGVLAILSGVGALAWWALSDGLSAASDPTWGFLVVLFLLWGLGAIAVGAAGYSAASRQTTTFASLRIGC